MLILPPVTLTVVLMEEVMSAVLLDSCCPFGWGMRRKDSPAWEGGWADQTWTVPDSMVGAVPWLGGVEYSELPAGLGQ